MSAPNQNLQAPGHKPVRCTYCGDSRTVTDRVDGEITCPECGYDKIDHTASASANSDLPEVISHRHIWRNALVIVMGDASNRGEDTSYWAQAIEAFDRAFTQVLPITKADTPHARPSRDHDASPDPAVPVDIAEWRKAMEGVTPGSWQVVVDEHPWSLPEREVLGRMLPAANGRHLERRIFTTWNHPQLKAPAHIVNTANGIGLVNGPPVFMVSIEEADAAWIARCSPVGLSALLDDLESTRRKLDEAHDELAQIREASQRWMEETGQAYAYVGIRDYAAACERAETHQRRITELVAENERLSDFGGTAVETAGIILENLGIGQDASKEPGADRRRDRIAALIERAMVAPPAKRPQDVALDRKDDGHG